MHPPHAHAPAHYTYTAMLPRSVCPSSLPTNAWPTWTSSSFRYVFHAASSSSIVIRRGDEGGEGVVEPVLNHWNVTTKHRRTS
jgi:hypothetical protein